MLKRGEQGDASMLDRALALLAGLTSAGTARDINVVAHELGLPGSTARRLAATLERHGLIARVAPGRYVAGEGLAAAAAARPAHAMLSETARPLARRLAERLGSNIHVGVLEQDMVTYVVCERGRSAGELFTREGMQLEAYCTAIGKMLLASLPEKPRDRYLAAGPFVALTPATITDPGILAGELADIRRTGRALEHGETAPDLACLAVPISDGAGAVVAAISAAWQPSHGVPNATLGELRRTAAAVATRLARNHGRRGGKVPPAFPSFDR